MSKMNKKIDSMQPEMNPFKFCVFSMSCRVYSMHISFFNLKSEYETALIKTKFENGETIENIGRE